LAAAAQVGAVLVVWRFRRVMGRTRTLDSHASRLRRKLDPERGRYVVNVWGDRR